MAKKAALLSLTPEQVRVLWAWGNHIKDDTTWFDDPTHGEVMETLKRFLLNTGDLQPTGFQLT